MRKLLITILIALLLSLSVYIALKGFEVGPIEVLSYQQIQQRDEKLNEEIQKASKKVETEYRNSLNNVKTHAKQLVQAQEEFKELTTVNEEGEVQITSPIEEYEVERLWVKLGTYATSEGVILEMDIKDSALGILDIKTTSGDSIKYYDLEFDVLGSYIAITDFISDIENDSTLGFIIEDFKMVPTDTSNLRATFACRDIAIKDVTSVSGGSSTQEDEDNNTNNTNSTNTNTANTNSTNTNSSNTNSNTTNTNTNTTNTTE